MRSGKGGIKSQLASSGLKSLRDFAKWRILHDMVENVKKHAQFSKDYLLLIVDASALKVFSSSCSYYELMQSDLYHIERLEYKRKRFL